MAPDPSPSRLRIGDTERDRAAESLGAHLRAGRLSPTEYDERVQAAFGARTATELTPLFADLPNESSPMAPPAPARSRPERSMPRLAFFVVALAAVIAFTVVAHFPPFFLIPLFWFGFGRRFARTPHHGYGYGGPRRRRY